MTGISENDGTSPGNREQDLGKREKMHPCCFLWHLWHLSKTMPL